MKAAIIVLVVVVVLLLFVLAMSLRIVKQYEDGVLFRLGRVIGERAGRACGSSFRSPTCCTGCRCGS